MPCLVDLIESFLAGRGLAANPVMKFRSTADSHESVARGGALRMEIFPIGSLTLLLGGTLVCGACVCGLHLKYLRGARRYQQFLNDSYAEHFAQRALMAKSLHARLARTIQCSKSIVDQVRESSSDATKTRAALKQVSEWLEGAAGESDRALRSLESALIEKLEKEYVSGGAHVDSETDPHHDR